MNCNSMKDIMKMLDSALCNDSHQVPLIDNTAALIINLDKEEFERYELPETWMKNYVGGPALGARLWAHFAGAEADNPAYYESDNPIVISSPAPWENAFTVTFLSPQTHQLAINYADNLFGPSLRSTGFSAVIITGRARRLTGIEISDRETTFKLVEKMTGWTTSNVENEVKTTCISIGPAGENAVPFACGVCDGIPVGRNGLGCVMGVKNIKFISVASVAKPTEGTAVDNYIAKSKTFKKIQTLGTDCIIPFAMKSGWAPIDNFSLRTDPRLFHLSGMEFVRKNGPQAASSGCGYAYTLMLGSNTGCYDAVKVFARYKKCVELGLDGVSVGNIIGWMKQACEKELFKIPSDLCLDNNDDILKIIEMTARKTGIGEELSAGVMKLGSVYQAESFAYHINGLECGPFDFRGSFAQALNSSTGFDFPVFQAMVPGLCSSRIPLIVAENQNTVLGLLSLGVDPVILFSLACDMGNSAKLLVSLFPKIAKKLCGTEIVFKGTDINSVLIEEIGKKCWRLVYEINGLLSGCAKPAIPDYFAIEPCSNNLKAIVPIKKLILEYDAIRKADCCKQNLNIFETDN